jgi:selenocysteine lyase/cysteine desulfurase
VAWPVPAARGASPPIRSIRISAALHNDEADIDRLVAALRALRAGPTTKN